MSNTERGSEELREIDRCPECGSGSIRVTEDQTEIVACFDCETAFNDE